MKLKPNLEDGWTMDGITELSLTETSISGLGVSMKVILHIFKDDKDLVFYSYKPDDLYEEGDIFIFALEKSILKKLDLEKKTYTTGKSPIEYWYGESIDLEEYELTKQLREKFGFSFRKMFESQLAPYIKYNLYFHDNFIFGLFPINKEILQRVILNIKHLHSYYLDHEIISDEFNTQILRELRKANKIRLRSYKNEGKIVFIKKITALTGIKKFLRLKVKKETTIYEIN